MLKDAPGPATLVLDLDVPERDRYTLEIVLQGRRFDAVELRLELSGPGIPSATSLQPLEWLD